MASLHQLAKGRLPESVLTTGHVLHLKWMGDTPHEESANWEKKPTLVR